MNFLLNGSLNDSFQYLQAQLELRLDNLDQLGLFDINDYLRYFHRFQMVIMIVHL